MDTVQARQTAELVLPGCVIGLSGGAVAGALAAGGGLSASYAVATALTLGLSLAAFGIGYDLLLAAGRLRLGGVAPAALYWLGAFPAARTLHEVLFDVVSGRAITLPDAVGPFLAYQAILSVGFAVGFVWLHEYVFPRWWIRVRGHNPVAARYVEQYTNQAARVKARKK